jgi:hypothetical protein
VRLCALTAVWLVCTLHEETRSGRRGRGSVAATARAPVGPRFPLPVEKTVDDSGWYAICAISLARPRARRRPAR